MSERKWKIMIKEREDPIAMQITRTSRARQYLYDLIALFRKDAEHSADIRSRSMFEFAAEVIAGLARAFRQHEAEMADGETKKFIEEKDI